MLAGLQKFVSPSTGRTWEVEQLEDVQKKGRPNPAALLVPFV